MPLDGRDGRAIVVAIVSMPFEKRLAERSKAHSKRYLENEVENLWAGNQESRVIEGDLTWNAKARIPQQSGPRAFNSSRIRPGSCGRSGVDRRQVRAFPRAAKYSDRIGRGILRAQKMKSPSLFA